MAKKEKTAAASGEAKARKKPEFRSDAELAAGGPKEKVFLVVRKAFNLGKANNYSGTVRASKKFPAGILFQKGKKGGLYWGVNEDGDQFKALYSAAKNAISDLTSMKYTDNVRKVIDLFSEIGEGGRGSRTVSMESLKSIKL